MPILAYWDDYDMVPWALPQVYDFMEGRDATSYEYPLMNGTYNRRHYLTAYSKEQHTEFGTIYVDADGTTSSYSGSVSFENGVATLGDAGSATYTFSVSSAGTYDIAIRLCYPFQWASAFTSSCHTDSAGYPAFRLAMICSQSSTVFSSPALNFRVFCRPLGNNP